MAVKNTKTTKKSSAKPRKPSSSAKKEVVKREFAGFIYIILSVITMFSILNFEGFLLDFYKKIITFFIGYGMYVLPISFFILGVLCFTNFKGNVALRSYCMLIMPVSIACFAQVLAFDDTYNLNFADLKTIIELGFELKSAGILGGFISIVLESGLSSIGALILLFIFNFILTFICFNITPIQAYNKTIEFFEALGYEEDYEEDNENEEETEYQLSQREKRKIKKEKQKEEIAKVKQAKTRAYNQYKENVEVKVPKKYKEIDFDLTDEKPLENEEVLEKEVETKDYKKEHWMINPYKNTNNVVKEQVNQTNQSNEPCPIEALEQKIRDFEEENKDLKPFTYDDIEKEIAKEIEVLTKEKEDFIKNKINEPEIFIAPGIIVKDNEIKEDIEKAIEETVFEKTAEFVYQKTELTEIDDLKSTMRYENISGFDKEKLEYKYTFPPIDLLTPKIITTIDNPVEELKESSNRLIDTLKSFNIDAEIIHIVRGPSITRFEIQISKGITLKKVTGLSDDIALSLGAVNVMISPVPEKVAIGIEVPNKSTETVLIREVIESDEFKQTESKLAYALGKDITGSPYLGDISKMPHMLIAGTTGSGKSVCINSLLVSLLYKARPDEVKLIMIDPKMVELGGYNGIPHLLIPVVTDPKKAAGALNWAVGEMLKRYKLFAENNVKDLVSYNLAVEKKVKLGEELEKLPQIVIVIDELADLMMIAAKEVEESICRIAQMARAAGMHLVIATQRPSSDVITGIMKANIPSRISFAVSSQIESRIILDTTGADKLIGKGDMLYNPLGVSKPQRLQGCFITSSEVEAVVDYVKTVAEPDYNNEVLSHIENHQAKDNSNGGGFNDDDGEEDAMLEDAIEVIVSTGQASTSFLQRKLKVGYARASRMMDQIEDRGIVGSADGSKQRQILITKNEWYEMKIRRMD